MATKQEHKAVRLPNKQAWIDTIVYFCPYRGGSDVIYHCEAGGEPHTNCTGRSACCTYVTDYLHTFCKFVNKELEI